MGKNMLLVLMCVLAAPLACATGVDDIGSDHAPRTPAPSGDDPSADPPAGDPAPGDPGTTPPDDGGTPPDPDAGSDTGTDPTPETGTPPPPPPGSGPWTEHGSGTCAGGADGDISLSHLPKCPSDPGTFYTRFAKSRSMYYGDGIHFFEPAVVKWDPTIAAVAQDYANKYAKGMLPVGGVVSGEIGAEPFYDGTYSGYRAITGKETPLSCVCKDSFGKVVSTGGGVNPFYFQGSALFRTYVIRMSGMSRMGVGHVETSDGSHYWTLLFGT